MYKRINLFLIMSLIVAISACSMGRKARNTQLIGYNGAIYVDSSVLPTRADEIYQAIKTNLEDSMVNNGYKYGAKNVQKTFNIEQLRVLVGSCGTNGSACDVDVFIDKANDTMRPLFVIDPVVVASCPDKYKAKIKSVLLLSKEALAEGSSSYFGLTTDTTVTSFDSFCSDIPNNPSTPTDFICSRKNDINSFKKISSYSEDFGVTSFDVSTSSSTIKLSELSFKNIDNNIVCINSLIKPSLWGQARKAISGNPKKIAVFKVSLEMVQ
jgi:hypothetical protein